ncbi:MAG TPA: hypothetical protein VJB38_09595, partial [Bacteroidota bacterium]|nr:hypothetical protein [Bacteroidota bacterium]
MNRDLTTFKPSLHVLFGCILFAVVFQHSSLSQTVQENLYVTNGTVRAVLANGNTIYIAGDFTIVGPYTGSGVALDTASGAYDAAFPKVNGTIRAVVPDGAGGFYIGGNFTSVGGVVRNRVAHIKSDKTLDATWNPNANGVVYALAGSGSTLYAGGEFTAIGGQARLNIAALDSSTGAATSWNPSSNFMVFALALS